ncbi:MAG: hypothetical protein HOE90_19900 [Bacteriovoracaceae bacterium]|jgi:TolB protein|nr:hypothetical protein [Bacteriovoracaceae bacterium]
MKLLICSICLILLSGSLFGQTGFIRMGVGKADLEADRIAIPIPLKVGNFSVPQSMAIKEIYEILVEDFSYYKKDFEILAPDRLPYMHIKRSNFFEPDYKSLSRRNFSYTFHLRVKSLVLGKNGPKTQDIKVDARVYRVRDKKLLLEKEFVISSGKIRKGVHGIGNDIYTSIKNKQSIFNSKILFVSDQGSQRGHQIKELFIMDFDGRNSRQLSRHNAVVVSPAISHNREMIAYTVIKKSGRKKTVDLYMHNLRTGRMRLLSNRPGINSGAVFTPDDKSLLLTLSYSGNAEIYQLNLKNKRITPLTKHYSDDVDPSISRDGRMYTFLSNRSGRADVYTAKMGKAESGVKRISYVGKFNATPRYSPNGKYIAFSSWVDNRFDIYRINSSGTGLVRLTKNFGSNEDPSFSNDGQFIVFTSQRVLSRTKAIQNLYIMDKDGEILGRLTKGFGNCISPRWTH